MGLQAFMLDSAPTLGSIETSTAQKRRLAAQSMAFNLQDATFLQLFPQVHMTMGVCVCCRMEVD
jgi:ubiquitin-conjugating enzyme E2 J2